MKFNVATNDLKRAMTTVKKGMTLNGVLPIVNCIRMNTTEDSLGLVGTDLEVMIAEEIPAHVELQGEACIMFKQLEACIKGKKTASHATEFEARDGFMVVTVDGVASQLSIMSVTEYPVIAQIETNMFFELASGLEKCLPFVSTEETRHILEGVHVHSKKNELVFVGTDGRTMKVVRENPLTQTEKPGVPEFAITIPAKACRAIVTKFKESVTVGVDDSLLRVSYQDRELITKLIEQEYPDYESVLEPVLKFQDATQVELHRETFLETIMGVCSVQGRAKYSKIHPVWIDLVDGEMEIKYNDLDKKVTKGTTHTPFSSGGDLLLILNPRLLLRVLNSFDTEYVTMYAIPGKEDDHNPMGVVIHPIYFGGDPSEHTILMPRKDKPPKFGPDWVAVKKEEEAEASMRAAFDELARQDKNLKDYDEWKANQSKDTEPTT